MNSDLDALLDEMLSKMHEIARKAKSIQKIKFEHVFDRIKALRDTYKPAKCNDNRQENTDAQEDSTVAEIEEVDDFEPPARNLRKELVSKIHFAVCCKDWKRPVK